jgi:hypothetical protein
VAKISIKNDLGDVDAGTKKKEEKEDEKKNEWTSDEEDR